uniref:transferrin-binding protein-like solute binding protein n=1 Tax=uncultured Sphingomonas sp. TaxID=158754 RepID=UPI0035CA5DC2
MRNLATVIGSVAILALAGCGGSSDPQSAGNTPPPPTPTNTSLTNLQYSQSFANDAATASVALDLTTKTGISGTSSGSTLTISYDAKSQGYTVSVAGRSQTFTPADIPAGAANPQAETLYQKTDGTNRDYLTLVKVPFTGTQATQYVGLGFWQHNVVTGTRQDTNYATFTYGLPSDVAAVPRTGTAAFRIDAFGFVSKPGQEPLSFQGQGTFSVDFAAGIFSAQTYNTETGLVTGRGIVGGGIDLIAAGHLSSSNTFSGNALYGGQYGSAGGALNGRFYGPTAQELGASFSANGVDGFAVAGSFTGERDTSATPANLTLTNLTQPQLFYTQFPYNSVGQLNWQNAETFTYSPPTSDLYGGQFTIADKVAGTKANFTTYRKTFSSSYDSQDVTLELYKPGSGNSELALTYASFGHWSTNVSFGTGKQPVDQYFAYGLSTPARLLSGKTGTGHYAGILYGTAATTTARFDVKGSSQFDVDFGKQSFTGALAMAGAPAGGAAVDFGSFDFAGKLGYSAASTADITRGGQTVGQISSQFYGPDGEEIAGPFALQSPAGSAAGYASITGVAIAKRP